MATHSNIFAWRIPWTRGAWRDIVLGVPKESDSTEVTCRRAYFVYILHTTRLFRASLVAQRLKHLPPMQETRVQSLGREDPLEKEMATHSSILAWRIPWTEEPGGLQSTKSRTRLSDFTYLLGSLISVIVTISCDQKVLSPTKA